jgi:hypothetical protein
MIFEDQLAALEADSKRVGTQGQEIDFALLVDGLAAEREQGITIDVAYRFFATEKRKFIVADTPGHEQYTRNMVTGASTADAAVILIDARKGVLTQTRRHSYLVSLIGIRHIVLAVNKMDLVGYSREVFDQIVDDYRAFADEAGIGDWMAIPVSGLAGDTVVARSAAMDWYGGPSLLEHAVAGVDEDDRQLARRCAGGHVARVLLVAGRVGDDELAAVGREVAVGDVDGDALLALGLQAVGQEGEVDLTGTGGADLLAVALHRGELVLVNHLGVVEQAADERALPIVDAASRADAEQTRHQK